MCVDLEKKSKVRRQGIVRIKVNFSSEKNSQVAVQEHRHLLRIFALHEIEAAQVINSLPIQHFFSLYYNKYLANNNIFIALSKENYYQNTILNGVFYFWVVSLVLLSYKKFRKILILYAYKPLWFIVH